MKSGQEISEVDQRWRQKLFNEAPEPAKPKTPKTPKEPKTPKPPKVPGSQVERAPKRGPGRPTGYSPINGYVQSPLSRPLNIQPLNNFSSPEKYTAWVPSSNQYVPQGFSELSESFTHNKVMSQCRPRPVCVCAGGMFVGCRWRGRARYVAVRAVSEIAILPLHVPAVRGSARRLR